MPNLLRVGQICRKLMVDFVLLSSLAILFAAVWPVRDIEIVERVKFVDAPERLELYDERVFCGDLPACLRVGHKVVIGGIAGSLSIAAELSHYFGSGSILDLQSARRLTENLGPYLMFRVLVVAALGLALRRILGGRRQALAVTSLLLIWYSGFPIRFASSTYGKVRDFLGISYESTLALQHHLSRQSTAYVLEYDLSSLVVTLCQVLLLTKRSWNRSLVVFFMASFASTLFFEHLGLVFLIATILSQHRQNVREVFQKSLAVGLGWLLPLIALVLTSESPGSDLTSTAQYYFTTNREHQSVINHFFVFFLIGSFAFGYLFSILFTQLLQIRFDLRRYTSALVGVTTGLTTTYVIGFFNSGLASEFGRQTLSGQLLALLCGICTGARRIRHGILSR